MTETITAPTPLGAPPPKDVLLDVRNLKTYFHVLDGERDFGDNKNVAPLARPSASSLARSPQRLL